MRIHPSFIVAAALLASCATAPDQQQSVRLLERGMERMQQLELDGAIANFSQLIELDPLHQQALAGRGHAWVLKNDPARALPDLDEALRLNPTDWRSRFNRGVVHMLKEEGDLALTEFDAVLELQPENAEARVNRGNILYVKKQYDRAIEDFDVAIRQYHWSPAIFLRRGDAWQSKGDYDKAIADFSRAIDLYPESIDNRIFRAHARLRTDEYDKALMDANEAIRMNEQDHRGFYIRGRVWYYLKEYDKALADFNAAQRLKPDEAGVYWARSQVWFFKMDYARLVEDYEATLRHNATSADHTDAGIANFYLGRFAESVDKLRRGLAAEPEHPYAPLWLYLAIRRAQGDHAARQVLLTHRGAEGTWPQPVRRFYLGELSSQEVFEAAASDPATAKANTCEAQFYVGQWHLLQGNLAQARQLLEASARECPNHFIEYHGALAELKRWQAPN